MARFGVTVVMVCSGVVAMGCLCIVVSLCVRRCSHGFGGYRKCKQTGTCCKNDHTLLIPII